eukprot:743836-Pelagomonas_calceolata.AAC.1
MKQGTPISLQDFADDLRHRLRGAWRAVEGGDLRTTNNKLATYQAFFALPFDQSVCKPIRLPGYLHLDLPRHVMQNVSRFRLRAHKVKEKEKEKEKESYASGSHLKVVLRKGRPPPPQGLELGAPRHLDEDEYLTQLRILTHRSSIHPSGLLELTF